MTYDNACFDFIKSHEGLRLDAYQDSAGIWTIGYGTILYGNNTPVKKGDTITADLANELIQKDIYNRTIKLSAILESIILNQNQYNALVSFAYNAGIGALISSTLLKQVKANPSDPAIRDSFMVWDKAHINGQLVVIPGLEKRRSDEANLYFS